MMAARLYGPRDIQVERVPHPGNPGPGNVLLRVTATGICGSDWGMYLRDKPGPRILGHEMIGTIEKLHPLQKAFIEEQAAQCGFCTNGVIMTAKAFLDTNPKASKKDIQQALSGVLCRCFTHTRIWAAIEKAQREMAR